MFWKTLRLFFFPKIIDTHELNDKELVHEVAFLMNNTERNIFVLVYKEVGIIDDQKIDQLWVDFYFIHNTLPMNVKIILRNMHKKLIIQALNNYY